MFARKSRHLFIEEVILFLSMPCVIRGWRLISAHVPKRPAPEINTLIPGTESPALRCKEDARMKRNTDRGDYNIIFKV